MNEYEFLKKRKDEIIKKREDRLKELLEDGRYGEDQSESYQNAYNEMIEDVIKFFREYT